MEETNRAKYEWQLYEFDPVGIPSSTIFGRDGNITRSPIIVCLIIVNAGILGNVLAEEFGYARAGSDGAVGQSSGDFDLFA